MANQPRAVHLPPFMSKDVRFWFLQVEALFRTSNVVADQARFDYVIAALDLSAATDIRDILENPPAQAKYQTLKDALIQRLAVSEAARIQKLLSNEQIGDRTPSQHLRYLRELAGANFTDVALASIWRSALPADVQRIVVGNETEGLSLDNVAKIADRVTEIDVSRREIHAATNAGCIAETQIAAISKQISALTKTVTNLSRSSTAAKPQSKQDKSKAKETRSRSPHPSKHDSDDEDNEVCWYHRRYKEKAQKCNKPCAWKSGNGKDRQ